MTANKIFRPDKAGQTKEPDPPQSFWRRFNTMVSSVLNEQARTRIATLLFVLIILALIFSPIITRKSDQSSELIFQMIFGGVLLLIMTYGLRFFNQSQETLRLSEEQFRLIIYATNDIVWDWNLLTGRLDWNRNIQRTFGYPADQIGQDITWWEARLHPDDRITVAGSIYDAIDKGEDFWSKEYRFCRADGSYANVFDRGYVLYDDHGKPVRMLGAMMDISRWRFVEEQLATERNLLRTLVDQLPDRIYVKDEKSRFLLKNLADVHVMGAATTDEVVGKTDFDYYSPDLAALYYADDQDVIQTGQSLINREELSVDVDGNQCWISTTKIPLRDLQGQIVGLVGIGHDVTDRKQAEEALQRANQQLTTWVDELERRSRETTYLNQLSDLLQACPNEKEAYSVISKMSHLLFPEDAGRLYMISASRNQVDSVASWGRALPDPLMFKPDDCWGLRLGRLYLVEKPVEDISHLEESSTLLCNHVESPGSDALICAPLVAQGEALGLLHIRQSLKPDQTLGSKTRVAQFTESKQQLVRTVASSLGLALANLRLRDSLRQQSIRDPLTGLFNRRYMEETIEREIPRVNRTKHPLGVIMLDIDHFKRFNDTYGHEAGDVILRELGVFLRSQVRGEDIPCRLGGEEFVLILPDASQEVTKQRAEKLCEGIRHLNIKYRKQPLGSITVSMGVAVYPDHGISSGAVIRAADSALYRAKKAGRDCVVMAEAKKNL